MAIKIKISPDVAVRLTKYPFVQMVAKQINFLRKFSQSFLKNKNAFYIFIEFKFAKNWQNYNSRRLSKPLVVQLARLLA